MSKLPTPILFDYAKFMVAVSSSAKVNSSALSPCLLRVEDVPLRCCLIALELNPLTRNPFTSHYGDHVANLNWFHAHRFAHPKPAMENASGVITDIHLDGT